MKIKTKMIVMKTNIKNITEKGFGYIHTILGDSIVSNKTSAKS